MRFRSATEPSSPGRPNEDFVGTAAAVDGRGGAVVVLDGVTQGGPGEGGCRHGVTWYSGRLGAALLERCGTRPRAPLTDCLADAIGRTADAHRLTCDLSHPRTPQATVACARWDGERVEQLVLCDAALLVEEGQGQVRAVLDERLAEVAAAARLLPLGERAAFIEGRRNATGGFFTAAADPAVAGLARTGSTPRERVRSLAALSDGVGRWVDVFGLGDWPELFAALDKRGPEAVIAEVREAEAADPKGEAFPRGKIHDDATVALAEL